MKIDLIDTAELTSQLTITIEPADYKSAFDKELNNYRQKVQIKGFRKGKTPVSAIKKMYGKAVLADVINQKVEKTLQDYIVDHEIDILGNPLPSADHKMIQFDVKEMGDYEYKFDLGRAPQIDVKGASASDSYDDYAIKLGDDDINEEYNNLMKRLGEQKEIDDASVEEMDILRLNITEKAPLGDTPYTNEISIMPERMTDDYKSKFIGSKAGQKYEINIFDIEIDAKEDYVRKYFLKDAPEDVSAEFEAEIMGIKRLIVAEPSEETFEKAFGTDGPKTEAEAKEKLREDLEKFYETQAKAITKRKVLENLVDQNEISLPDAFMKRWLKAANQNVSDEQIDQEYPAFAQNLKWTLIKQTLGKQNDIKIEPEDIRTSMVEKFKAQFAQYGYSAGLADLNFDDIGDRLMQNQESVQQEYEELLAERVLDQVISDVSLNSVEIDTKKYKELVEEFNS